MSPPNTPPGPAVDASGQAVVDPTTNVKESQAAAIQRIDDMAHLRALYTERIMELREGHTEQVAALRQDHIEKMQVKETERLDAIRAVDAASAREQAAAAETRATTLAGQVQAAADAARTTVDAARVSASESQAAALAPIQEALAAVQRFQYEAVGGKTQVTETQARGANSGLWIGLGIAALVGFLSLVLMMLTLAVAVYVATA